MSSLSTVSSQPCRSARERRCSAAFEKGRWSKEVCSPSRRATRHVQPDRRYRFQQLGDPPPSTGRLPLALQRPTLSLGSSKLISPTELNPYSMLGLGALQCLHLPTLPESGDKGDIVSSRCKSVDTHDRCNNAMHKRRTPSACTFNIRAASSKIKSLPSLVTSEPCLKPEVGATITPLSCTYSQSIRPISPTPMHI